MPRAEIPMRRVETRIPVATAEAFADRAAALGLPVAALLRSAVLRELEEAS